MEQNSDDKFVSEVAGAIYRNESKEGSFIFGLSGKWGEGKSHFLDNLANELYTHYKNDVVVTKLSPWKFSDADNSILRELLRNILELYPRGIRKYRLSNELRAMNFDINKNRIRPILLIVVVLLFALLGTLYVYTPEPLVVFKDWVSNNKTAVTLLFIPVVIGLANSITTSQLSTKAISTQDKFDELMKKLLKHFKTRKIVVFVDDLDRLTADKAMRVLDNLRTFFDNEKLVFVVACDHSVLERHLGSLLSNQQDENSRMDEGRRYLKKIFNVSWRLPMPTKPKFENYVLSLIESEESSYMKETMVKTGDLELFKTYLLLYFQRNYRNVERFVSRVSFTFRIIEAQRLADGISEQNKGYFNEMIDNPILVVRVLLIEEMANTLFEDLQQNPELLLNLEKSVTQSGTQDPGFIEAIKKLSDDQKTFITSYINDKPRFCDENGIKISSIEPYILLSSDSSFGDIRGLSPEEFMKYLEDDKIADLAKNLDRSGERKLNEAIDSFFSKLPDIDDVVTKIRLFSNLIQVAITVDPKLPARSIIVKGLVNSDLGFFEQVPVPDRKKLTSEISSLGLDVTDSLTVLDKMATLHVQEWADITTKNDQPVSVIDQHRALRYLKANPTILSTSITQLGSVFDKFDIKIVKLNLNDFTPTLVQGVINEVTTANRDNYLKLLEQTDDGKRLLEDDLTEQLKVVSAPVLNWLMERVRQSIPLLSIQEIVDSIFSSFDGSIPNLSVRINALKTFPESTGPLWSKLLSIDGDLLINTLFELALVTDLSSIAPPSNTANKLLDVIVRRFVNKSTFNSAECTNWLNRITPSSWIFSNLRLTRSLVSLINNKLNTTTYIDDVSRDHLNRILVTFKTVKLTQE